MLYFNFARFYRFYEFGESAITCIRFSTVCPNRLAVGFHNGEILIIDISSECLQIVYQKSKQSTLDINGILGLFWTVRVDNGLLRANRSECLVNDITTFIFIVCRANNNS